MMGTEERARMAKLARMTKAIDMTKLAGMPKRTGAAMAPESGTVRNVRRVVIDNTVAVPVGSPVMPTPAVAAKYSDPDP